jgi:uncharacterized protein
MLRQLAKVLLLSSVLSGLCAPVQANTSSSGSASEVIAPVLADAVPASGNTAATAAASGLGAPIARVAEVLAPPKAVNVALLLPLNSDMLGDAADALRAGFMAAWERERGGIAVDVLKTDDTPADVLARYRDASARYDIIVGPLSRTGVTAVAQSGAVSKPTIALNGPDSQGGVEPALPPQMLSMGLSIDDEARQVADWASANRNAQRAFVIFTDIPWQRRAATAFAARWQRPGFDVQSVEIGASGGYLDWRRLAHLKKQLNSGPSALLFAALDAWQARQLRQAVGEDVPLYGTSQMNPFALEDWPTAERMADMNGVHLLDIPWQLDADHPAAMIYPRPVVDPDKKRSPDNERLYALGIDAYRVAREIAVGNTMFELDGVTGRLSVQFSRGGAHFERTAEHAIYRDGEVVSAAAP